MSNEKVIIELEKMINEQKSFLDEVCMQLKNLASNLPSQDGYLLTQIVDCSELIKTKTNRLDFLMDVRKKLNTEKTVFDAVYSVCWRLHSSDVWKTGMELLRQFQNFEK